MRVTSFLCPYCFRAVRFDGVVVRQELELWEISGVEDDRRNHV